jgi:uncharacterized protein
MSRPRRQILAALVGIGALLFALAAPASAHVTVNPREAQKGGFAKLTFRVPTERDDASTTQLDVQMPTDHPIASVSVQPVTGWTYTVTEAPLPTPIETDDGQITSAVTSLTWKGGEIKPGEFQEFSISVGPLPTDADSLTFKAIQTYSDGQTVNWIETANGSTQPEHPAPVLKLTDASASAASPAAATTSSGGDSSDTAARALGIVGIVVGATGLIVGGLALSRRKPGSTSGPTAG